MGNIEILEEQLRLGVPLKHAAVLAGYEKDEIPKLAEDPKIESMVALAKAEIISDHIIDIRKKSKKNSQDSKWLLEKVFPEDFSGKILDADGNEVLRVIIQKTEKDVL